MTILDVELLFALVGVATVLGLALVGLVILVASL